MSVTSTLPASLSANQKLREIHHWINGECSTSTSGRFGDVFNPATGEVQARVALASPAEVNAAVAAAAAAFPAWSAQPPLRRARVLFRFREIFEQRMDEVAQLLTSEHGKVFSDARGEATRGLENIEFATGIPQLLKGEFTEQVGTGIDYDVLEGTLTFSKDGVPKVVAEIQIVGTTSFKSSNWLWAWANSDWPRERVTDSERVRAFGAEHGICELTHDYVEDSDLNALGWALTAAMVRVTGAFGAGGSLRTSHSRSRPDRDLALHCRAASRRDPTSGRADKPSPSCQRLCCGGNQGGGRASTSADRTS